MSFSVVVFSLWSPLAAGMPAGAVERLEAFLSDANARAVVVLDEANVDRRCRVDRLMPTDTDFVAARAAKKPLRLRAIGTGRDARGRGCRVTVDIDVSWRERARGPRPRTTVRVAAQAGDLLVETRGVVVPCPADVDEALVCARTDTGKSVGGVIEGDILLVSDPLPRSMP